MIIEGNRTEFCKLVCWIISPEKKKVIQKDMHRLVFKVMETIIKKIRSTDPMNKSDVQNIGIMTQSSTRKLNMHLL